MSKRDAYDVLKIAREVDKICSYFLDPIGISYFQFKRTYKNHPPIIIANNIEFFKEFLKDGFVQLNLRVPFNTRQSHFCFWDETLTRRQLSYFRKAFGIYHGLTILSRHKNFYDCASFAMSEPHSSPVAYYLLFIKDLQDFSEQFPSKAKKIIQEVQELNLKVAGDEEKRNRNAFFLPKRSDRFYLGEQSGNYVTTYEALCAQLAQQGKSYKEIGSILSMGSGTVKTHLMRLKARTGLSLQEVSFQLLHAYQSGKSKMALENEAEDYDRAL